MLAAFMPIWIRCAKAMWNDLAKVVAIVALGSATLSTPSMAQESSWSLGVGAMVGRTSGFTVKQFLGDPGAGSAAIRRALELNVTSDVDDFFLGTLYLSTERPIPQSPLHSVMGPGIVFGVRNERLFAGISAAVGVHFPRGRYEVFLQLSPVLRLVPDVDGEVGASVGMRYFF